jgi:hypothetical protein
MGRLEQIETRDHGAMDFPEGCWLAWDPRHPRQHLHIILTSAMREKFRSLMKHAKNTMPIQRIAERAGGEQARHPLPNVKGVSLGPIASETYFTEKTGDDWSSYVHEHGGDGLGGHLPYLAMDVSGRLWFCGGSLMVREAGIVG